MFRIYRSKLGFLTGIGRSRLHNEVSKACSKLPSVSVNENSKLKQTFDEMNSSRKNEAAKSIVVQVNSENSYPELFTYCSQFGIIRNAFHYNISDEKNHFILLEYQDKSECEEMLKNCDFHEDNPGVPTVSRFLWFKTSSKKANVSLTQKPVMLISDLTRLVKDDKLNELLQAAETVDDQMLILHRATRLTDLGTRLRFLAAKQLETALEGMFSNVQAHPFGSSVNGFGKMGCDLDMILQFHPEMRPPSKNRLIFHTRAELMNSRSQMQKQMETLGDIMHLFLPGITFVRKILQARVPIIKFNHECLDLEVDLSMGNLSGVYMSELLYLLGEIDDRVRPLTFCIRKWAYATGLTNSSPGNWVTNFSLTILVLFFLQNLKNPILPTINHLIKSATSKDIRITQDYMNCTFLRDINSLNFRQQNEDSLSYLLIQFFEFYSQFDFKNSAVSLLEGKPIQKTDHAAMWIENPLEPTLNVSKNVSFEELERFKFNAKNAAWVLESSTETDHNSKRDENYWGLLNLFKTDKKAIVSPHMFFKSRLVDVSELFNSQDPIKFKSNVVENEVKNIRQTTKRQIKKLEQINFKKR